jgi:hypothetical protein
VTVIGGFATCATASPTGRTVIGGSAAGTGGTFTTSGTAGIGGSTFNLVLRNLELRDGGNLVGRRGGALRIGGQFDVTLSNVVITGNEAGRGGGVYLDGSNDAQLFVQDATSINNNVAGVSGGGVYCINGGFISLGRGVIEDNSALDNGTDPNESGNGGGVALYGQCRMFHSGNPGTTGVRDNYAERHGGGYYLRSADLSLFGGALAPAWVLRNRALDTGGGIAVNDDISGGIPAAIRSEVSIEDSRIEENGARLGGGIGLVVGGQVTMQRTRFGGTCHDATRCSTLSRNRGPEGGDFCLAAGLYAGLIGQVSIQQTFIEENCRLLRGWGTRVADNARVRIDSSVMARNADSPFGFEPSFDGQLDFSWSTMTGHVAAPRLAMMQFPPDATATGRVRLFGSILGEPFERLYSVAGGGTSPMSVVADCLLIDTTYNQPTAPFRMTELASPWGMASPASGNYRPAGPASAPVDYCDLGVAPRIGADMDGGTLPVDLPVTDLFGPRDLGAYEVPLGGAERIFADGFDQIAL